MSVVSAKNRPPRHEQLDGRSWQARLLKQTRADLAADLGGTPTAAERGLIDRAGWLTVHLAQLDRRMSEGLALDDPGHYAELSAALAATLGHLGRQDAAPLPGLIPRQGAAPVALSA